MWIKTKVLPCDFIKLLQINTDRYIKAPVGGRIPHKQKNNTLPGLTKVLPCDFIKLLQINTDKYIKAPVGGRIPHKQKNNTLPGLSLPGVFFMVPRDISRDIYQSPVRA